MYLRIGLSNVMILTRVGTFIVKNIYQNWNIRIRWVCFHAGCVALDKIEVPWDFQIQSPETWQVQEIMVFRLVHMQVPYSPVNLMFDLELIATENRPTPFETIWLLYTPCKFRQKSRLGKSKKREEKFCQILARERFTAGLPYPGIFYVYALTVISGFNGVYLRYDF